MQGMSDGMLDRDAWEGVSTWALFKQRSFHWGRVARKVFKFVIVSSSNRWQLT